jgi:hypothetical protein
MAMDNVITSHAALLLHPLDPHWIFLLGLSDGELEVDVLAGQRTVDGREGVELVLEEVGVLGVKVAFGTSALKHARS